MEMRAKKAQISLSAYLRRVGVGEDLSQSNPAELFDELEEGVGHGNYKNMGHQG